MHRPVYIEETISEHVYSDLRLSDRCLRRRVQLLDNSNSRLVIAIKPCRPHPFVSTNTTLHSLGEKLDLEARRVGNPDINHNIRFHSFYQDLYQ
jgi:hypothetical protein